MGKCLRFVLVICVLCSFMVLSVSVFAIDP